ncbi:MAG: hypothetical protein JW712_08965 [Dehalococcoidales bacterium]|nr:hypothetical protein [Dehalococcoidales bacterium]
MVLMLGTMCTCTSEQPTNPQWFPEDILDGAGQVKISSDINSSRHVIVFEEIHTSRASQVEIAIMLNRLYSEYGLRCLALEGAVIEKETPNGDWFFQLPDHNVRREVALQLLGQGEISASEFMTMVYDDFHLYSIESENEYLIEPSDDASYACIYYLIAIAEKVLPQEKITTANELITAGEIDKASEIIFTSNSWIKTRYEALTSSSRPISIEEIIDIIEEIETKAKNVDADVKEYTEAFEELKKFYIVAGTRSQTMVSNTHLIFSNPAEVPIAMNVGSAHSAKVVDLLSDFSDSVVIITPLSINQQNGILSDLAYDRKLASQSVDNVGTLGAFLDERRKPPPVINEPWLQLKAELMYATVIIARAATAGGEPPFGLEQSFYDFEEFFIDPSSITQNSDNHVIFSVHIKNTGKTLWILTGQVNSELEISDETTLEEALLALLIKLKSEDEVNDEKQELKNSDSSDNPATIQISRDVLMKVTDKKDVILKNKLQ